MTSRLVVEDVEKQRRIISSTHDLSHFGVHRTNDVVSRKYYWPGLFNDVKSYVSLFTKPYVYFIRNKWKLGIYFYIFIYVVHARHFCYVKWEEFSCRHYQT